MFRNGRPYSSENGYVDESLFTHRTLDEIRIVNAWLKANIIPCKVPLLDYNSYTIKNILLQDTGILLTNNEFKDAMWLNGHTPVDPNAFNWCFCIRQRSPAFCRKKQENQLRKETEKEANIKNKEELLKQQLMLETKAAKKAEKLKKSKVWAKKMPQLVKKKERAERARMRQLYGEYELTKEDD